MELRIPVKILVVILHFNGNNVVERGSLIITFLLSYYLLGEPLTPRLWLATLLILSGTMILMWK